MFQAISLLFFLIAFVACSDSGSSNSSEPTSDNEIEGFVLLKSGAVTIGTNDKSFKVNERPAMSVLLDYDFYMGIHEVTCGDYAEIAHKAKLKTFGKCENDSLPITDITYYDAVLFANAQSKQKKYDTAYTYSKAIYTNDGHCTNLEGFAFHADVKAFRLPTEAEWIYAATRAWNVKKSWNSGNSEYKLHSVCTAGSDSAGFCDIIGNAMEWVNDWMGTFRDTTITNYVGAPDGGNLGERIVKGGCYSSLDNELNPYSRGDVYTVTSSTKAEYVGFRLAFGNVPNALWMGNDGKSQTKVIIPLTGSETVKKVVGSYNVKLAFRNDVSGNIAIIDYLNGTQSVKEITKDISAYHPEISPDGKWIAYCTGFEGISGKSTIYVQNIEEEKVAPIKLDVEKAVIPRWRIIENDTVIVYVTDAGNNKDNSWKSQSTWQVPFANGKFGTPKKLFDGAYHGGISEDNALAVTGARLLRARIAKKGSSLTKNAQDVVWYDSAQACNASLAQDGTKRTAFLDFGGNPGKKFVGKDYATHERVFIADSTGQLIQSVKSPTGYSFDHTEWATDGETSIIAATLTNINGAHTKIALVNPADSSVTEIVEGEELWHPNLWVKKKATKLSSNSSSSAMTSSSSNFELDLDSAGMYYNTSGASDRAKEWRYKMEFLWKYRDTANVVIIGSSRTLFGINPLVFNKPYYAINLAITSAYLKTFYLFLHNYILPHMKKMKVVIDDIDIDRWSEISSGIFGSAYKSYPGYVYDINHNYWKDGYPEGLAEATYNSPGDTFIQNLLRPTRGMDPTSTGGWGKPTNPYIHRDSSWLVYQKENYNQNYNYLIQMIEECKNKNITFIGVITPQSPHYKNTGTFGKYGIRRSEAPALIKEIADLQDKYPNFILMDENKMGNHDYTDEMAHDEDHLAPKGAEQLTKRLDSLIRTLNIDFSH